MFEFLYLAQGIVERGLIFSIVVASVYISSRLIKFDNLAIEGAFGLGGAVAAIFLLHDYNPWISILVALFAGSLSGIITGLLHTKLKLNNLIAGIVVTTGLFSIVLKIAGSNIALHNKQTIFQTTHLTLKPYYTMLILVVLVSSLFFATYNFLKTEIGFLLSAVGTAPQMLINIGKNVDAYRIFGLVLSNTFAALSGALFVHYTGYFSIWSNIGMLIIGLAGMILAETISAHFGSALIIGSMIYQTIIALTFELELDQDWNKLITALMIIILLVVKEQFDKK